MSFEKNLAEMLRSPLAHLGYALICIQIHGLHKKAIDISIEHLDGRGVSIDDCVKANREAAAILDVENPIQGAYMLQVSSPGLDRPLVQESDYVRFIDQMAKITLHELLDGRKKIVGMLQGLTDGVVSIKITENGNEEVISIPFNDIYKARLIPNFDNKVRLT